MIKDIRLNKNKMENYKEKYEQALENFNKIRNANKDNKKLVDFIDYKYPELKEIDDKKIKEGLIEYLKELRDWTPTKLTPIKLKNHYDTWINYLEKQDNDKSIEQVFRPLTGCDINEAANQAVKQQKLGYKIVLAFNDVYIPVEEKTSDEIVNEYYSWFKKQRELIEKYENEIIPKFEVGNKISNGINTYLIMEIEKDGWYVTNKGSRLSFYTAHQHYHLA